MGMLRPHDHGSFMNALEREEEPSLMKARMQMERKWKILSKSGPPCKLAMLLNIDDEKMKEEARCNKLGFLYDCGSFEELASAE